MIFHKAAFGSYADHMALKVYVKENVTLIHKWLVGPLLRMIRYLQTALQAVISNTLVLRNNLAELRTYCQEDQADIGQLRIQNKELHEAVQQLRLQVHILQETRQDTRNVLSEGGHSRLSLADSIRLCQDQAYKTRRPDEQGTVVYESPRNT